jgi:branched-chain amino acid transport system permease protein
MFITLSQSWNILGGYAGQINLGHAAFFGLGSLATRLLWLSGQPFLIALLAGGVVALIFALIIAVPAFRLRGVYFLTATLVLAEIARSTVDNVFPTVARLTVDQLAAYNLTSRYYLALVLAVIVVAVVYALANSRPGLAMVSLREDEDTAEASGVDTFKYKLLALSLSTFFAGLAGGTFAFFHVSYYYGYVFHSIWTFDAVLIVFIGGVGTLIGPVIGAIFYVALRELFVLVLPPEIHVIVFGALFILVVLFMPGGLIELLGRARNLLGYFTSSSSGWKR